MLSVSFIGQIRHAVSTWRVRSQQIKELECYSDRELTDLGVSRYDIPALIDGKLPLNSL